mmetsp:Transcript_91547/g.296373  ORF Transcript_91547/g.296373 Transcript_91547/m.296373 type:complete len:281 (-) Transcript_91547:1400-2242(-)
MREGDATARPTHQGAAVKLCAEALAHVKFLFVEVETETLQEGVHKRGQVFHAGQRGGHPDGLVHGCHHRLNHRARQLARLWGLVELVATHGRLVHDKDRAVRIELPQQPGAAADVAHQVDPRIPLQVVQVSQPLLLGQPLLLALQIPLGNAPLQTLHGGHRRRLHPFLGRRGHVHVSGKAAAAGETRREPAAFHEGVGDAKGVGDAADSEHHRQGRAAEDEVVARKQIQQVRHHGRLSGTGRCNAKDQLGARLQDRIHHQLLNLEGPEVGGLVFFHEAAA